MLINLIGFAAMALDKRRAIRHKWRIPERTLFLIALLFGSIGVLTGMYVFRHKTKHLSFSIGIPAILVAQLLLLSFLYSWNLRRVQSPSQAVEHELALIEELDEPTIQSFISYENLTNSHLASSLIASSSRCFCLMVLFILFSSLDRSERAEDNFFRLSCCHFRSACSCLTCS